MSQSTDITEVSDHRELTVDPAPVPTPLLRVVDGRPTDAETAALIAVLSAVVGGTTAAGPQEYNPWGHPVDKLRYAVHSWQRVTLLERTHVRR